MRSDHQHDQDHGRCDLACCPCPCLNALLRIAYFLLRPSNLRYMLPGATRTPAWGLCNVTAFNLHNHHLFTASIIHTAGVSTQTFCLLAASLCTDLMSHFFLLPTPLLPPLMSPRPGSPLVPPPPPFREYLELFCLQCMTSGLYAGGQTPPQFCREVLAGGSDPPVQLSWGTPMLQQLCGPCRRPKKLPFRSAAPVAVMPVVGVI